MTAAATRKEKPGYRRCAARLAIRANIGLTMFLWLLITATALLYCYSAFCAYTNFKFTLIDYGRYVNTIWNCAHGHPFRLLTELSYLNTHLSFSLYLLAPVFWLWDDPFALWIGGWFYVLIGCGIMTRAMLRAGVPAVLAAAFLLCYLLNPFTQTVLLAEFHGVNLYLLLFPWLYYCLCFQRRLAWLPLLLVWGVREEAAFLAVPMLLYFAFRDHWRTGHILAACSGLYGLLACTALFQWINGFSLARPRPDVASLSMGRQLACLGQPERLLPMLRLLTPTLVFLDRGWVPILVFPSLAVVMTLLSPYPAQYQLRYHYPAAPLILLMLGIVQAMVLSWSGDRKPGRISLAGQVVFLLALAVAGHAWFGLLPGGGCVAREYRTPSLVGLSAICAAEHLPRDGQLLTSCQMAGLVANRKDLLSWDQYDGAGAWSPEIIFTTLRQIGGFRQKSLRRFMRDSSYGVVFWDNIHVIMERGAPSSENREILTALTNGARTIRFARTRKKIGKELVDNDCRIVRYVPGDVRNRSKLLAYGKTVVLDPGKYRAVFLLKVGPPVPAGSRDFGTLQLVERASQRMLARQNVVSGDMGQKSYCSHLIGRRLSNPRYWQGVLISGWIR